MTKDQLNPNNQGPSLARTILPGLQVIGALVWCALLAQATILTGAERAGSASGITESFLEVTVSAPTAGIIQVYRHKEGDVVKEGEVILELDKRLEELEVERRKLVVENRKFDLEATEQLFKKSTTVSREEMEKRQTEYRIAAVEYELALENLRRRQVLSPLSGIITEIIQEAGEACQPYQPLVKMVDTSRCYFIANMEARTTPPLKVNQELKMEIDADGGKTVNVQGKVVFVSPISDPASGLYKVKVLFNNAAGQVRPGLAGKMFFN